MSEKKRHYRLRNRIKTILREEGYDVFNVVGDNLFHLIAVKENHARIILVCLEKPTQKIVDLVAQEKRRARKEIWYRVDNNRIEVMYF